MQRLKALFRARAIKTPGTKVYEPGQRTQWLRQLPDDGVRFRARVLYDELAVLQELRPKAKTAMLTAARRDPAWKVLRTIPFLGPVRVAVLLAALQTPWRFRTKRNLWAYAGFAVVTRTSAEYEVGSDRRIRRRRRRPTTRGLNRNHNRMVKDVFKSAATAAATRRGALQDWYNGLLARGMRAELAPCDARPEACGPHAAPLENRRTLRSSETGSAKHAAKECASAITRSASQS